jgi:hypothetical protein
MEEGGGVEEGGEVMGDWAVMRHSGEERRRRERNLDLCSRAPGFGLELGLGSSRLGFLLLSTDELHVLVIAALGLVEDKVSLTA